MQSDFMLLVAVLQDELKFFCEVLPLGAYNGPEDNLMLILNQIIGILI